MTWQECYEIAASLRQRADRLFDENEHQYAGEGVWGALHYTARALAERFGRNAGQSLSDGYIPERPNSPDDVSRRKQRWRAARRLHQHFYNSNLDLLQLTRNRAAATRLLDEAFAVLRSSTP